MRRRSTLTPLLLAVFSVACASPDGGSEGGSPDTTGVPSRAYNFTYAVTIPAPPPGTKSLRVWVPLAKTDPGVQLVRDVEIHAPTGFRITKEAEFGNEMVYVSLENPKGPTSISWTMNVTRFEDRGQGKLPTSSRYLSANRRIPIQGKAKDMARELGLTDSSTPLQSRAKKLYDDVLGGMKYDKNHEGWGFGDFEHSVTVCKGNCTDFHSRFIGVGRAAGIPVRFTMGIPMKPGPGTYNSYHCWAHWYDGKRWQPVDISEADKVVDKDPAKAQWFFGNLDANRISISFGRDITLDPKQAGAPLNYFVFPYAEADGKPVPMGKSDWKFTYR